MLFCDERDPRRQDRYWLGADLVVEIVSPDNPRRDIEQKRLDYAEGGIPEYWIINPLDGTLTIMTLQNNAYVEYDVFHRGDVASSVLLPGFTLEVDAVFDAR